MEYLARHPGTHKSLDLRYLGILPMPRDQRKRGWGDSRRLLRVVELQHGTIGFGYLDMGFTPEDVQLCLEGK